MGWLKEKKKDPQLMETIKMRANKSSSNVHDAKSNSPHGHVHNVTVSTEDAAKLRKDVELRLKKTLK